MVRVLVQVVAVEMMTYWNKCINIMLRFWKSTNRFLTLQILEFNIAVVFKNFTFFLFSPVPPAFYEKPLALAIIAFFSD